MWLSTQKVFLVLISMPTCLKEQVIVALSGVCKNIGKNAISGHFPSFNKLFFHAGEMGFGVIRQENHQAVFVSVLPPARNTITMDTRKTSSENGCAYWCLNSELCCYFLYAPDTGDCIMKKLL